VTPTHKGSFKLFRLLGIDVFLHWSWFVVAVISIQTRANEYASLLWNVLEYLALFFLVLLHEFGHSLACRSTGGTSNQIVLWPLGGVAYVSPPPRPGAHLWSLGAGPLVNLVFVPILLLAWFLASGADWRVLHPNAYQFVQAVTIMNAVLLIFNMLPIYPLDGGQILRSLLWFRLGPTRSLKITAIVGFIGVVGLVALAIWERSIWTGLIAVMVFMSCRRAFLSVAAQTRLDAAPQRTDFACPACRTPPKIGSFWVCPHCRTSFDTFETNAACPKCDAQFTQTQCLACRATAPISEWRA
jgi:Zn-dependent protease